MNKLNFIKLPKNTSLSTFQKHYWIKESFKMSHIREIIKLIYAKTLKEVYYLKDIYKAFYESHLAIQHSKYAVM